MANHSDGRRSADWRPPSFQPQRSVPRLVSAKPGSQRNRVPHHSDIVGNGFSILDVGLGSHKGFGRQPVKLRGQTTGKCIPGRPVPDFRMILNSQQIRVAIQPRIFR